MATKHAVCVSNVAGSTSGEEIKNFFSFCGKISDFTVSQTGDAKTAEIVFEKDTAMKTALLLNKTQLGPNKIEVSTAGGDAGSGGGDGSLHAAAVGERESDEITQEEKPRARILAEYLAHGYVIGDAAIERAISLDATHNVSNRFLSTLEQLDKKYHASDRAKAMDQSYGLSLHATSIMSGINSYFEKAGNTQAGRTIVKFYTDSSRQVRDIRDEAKRLADLKKGEHGGSAYKAAGLEKVFGKEKPAAGAAVGASNVEPSAAAAAAAAAAKNENI